MNIWNLKKLPLPPINTYKALNKDVDIKSLYDVCEEVKYFFETNKYMYAEYLILTRIVYRMKQKFRSAKDFKAIEKLNKTLQNFFSVNLASHIQHFMALIPTRYKDETYLPKKTY